MFNYSVVQSAKRTSDCFQPNRAKSSYLYSSPNVGTYMSHRSRYIHSVNANIRNLDIYHSSRHRHLQRHPHRQIRCRHHHRLYLRYRQSFHHTFKLTTSKRIFDIKCKRGVPIHGYLSASLCGNHSIAPKHYSVAMFHIPCQANRKAGKCVVSICVKPILYFRLFQIYIYNCVRFMLLLRCYMLQNIFRRTRPSRKQDGLASPMVRFV